MKLFLSHKIYRTLTLSRLLNALGAYIYNLVFVIYAASLPRPSLAIFLANMVPMIPIVFTFWIGVQADKSQNKGQKMMIIAFVQALLFTMVALIISQQTYLVFSIICLLNVVSDCLSDYGAGLRMPILQEHVAENDLMEAYSFSQFISYICQIAGQFLGIWLLTISNQSFALVAGVNAGFFLLSALVLYWYRQDLTHKPVTVVDKKVPLLQRFKELYQTMEQIFQQAEQTSFASLLLSVLVLNALGGAVGSIYNLYLLKVSLFGLSYGQALVLVQLLFLVGAILGSLTPHDYFAKQSLSVLLVLNSGLFALIGLFNLLDFPPVLALFLLAFVAYLLGKSNPKLDALLMANLPTEVLAQSNNFLSLLFTLSLPLGTFLFSVLAVYQLWLAWLVFACLSAVAFAMVWKNRKIST
ncbi:MFS transporter [Streptococcus cuniculipharyngis]|uniref:MFS transporter n=1 Tax=Streptococcus cuniculipharyngis TaxID=1562651 RepID=A0A5C5SEK3_9STRE|nr:MFS transporter [Streptococcus cuniculipharyngis]TWS99239.1 MFS transporter [Streptococcus cuniculipharyngis]